MVGGNVFSAPGKTADTQLYLGDKTRSRPCSSRWLSFLVDWWTCLEGSRLQFSPLPPPGSKTTKERLIGWRSSCQLAVSSGPLSSFCFRSWDMFFKRSMAS